MQRRTRIALAVAAAAGVALLGAGTAYADDFGGLLGGDSQASASDHQDGTEADDDSGSADSSDADDESGTDDDGSDSGSSSSSDS